jgi:hypothetical protein
MLTCSFCRFTQAALEVAVGKNGFSFLNTVQCREAFQGLWIQDFAEFDSD